MLKQEIVILDFEGFRYKKTGFIIKELFFCSNNYSDTILFLPPVSYNSLSASDKRSRRWVTKFLHVCLGTTVLIFAGFYYKFLSPLKSVSVRQILCQRERKNRVTPNSLAERGNRFGNSSMSES